MIPYIDPIFENVGKGLCIICNTPIHTKGHMTCSQDCHEKFIIFGEKKFGITKKVIDIETGISYRVPTRDIIEQGLTYQDLSKYPLCNDEQEKQNDGKDML